jgi:large subunit ribosomal protein L7/L12
MAAQRPDSSHLPKLVEEQTEFNVVLEEVQADKKIAILKVVCN